MKAKRNISNVMNCSQLTSKGNPAETNNMASLIKFYRREQFKRIPTAQTNPDCSWGRKATTSQQRCLASPSPPKILQRQLQITRAQAFFSSYPAEKEEKEAAAARKET